MGELLSNIAMTAAEMVEYLDASPVAAFGTILAGGLPYVEPSSYVRDGREIYMTANRQVEPVRMTHSEAMEFLSNYRHPHVGTPLLLSAATVRKDGTCYVSPLGLYWDGSHVYFHLLESRSMLLRLERNPRIAIATFTRDFPLRAVAVEGVAVRVAKDDPAQAYSHEIVRQNFESPVYAGLLAADALDNHEAIPSILFRIEQRSMVAWDESKRPTAVTSAAQTRIADTARIFMSMTTTHMPLQVFNAVGDAERVEDAEEATRWAALIQERHCRLTAKPLLVHEPTLERSVFKVTLDKVMAWDQAKDVSTFEDGSGAADTVAPWVSASELWRTDAGK